MIVLMPDTSKNAAVFCGRISKLLEQDRTFSFPLTFEFGIAEKLSPDSDMQFTLGQALADVVREKMKKEPGVHMSILTSLLDSLRSSRFETEQHSLRIQRLSESIAGVLCLPQDEIENLKKLALFHDIGKLSVPSDIMEKPSKLNENEMRIIQRHVITGCKIAKVLPELAPIAREILCHHERWDGSGYPNGYSGEQIPYLSRIISVADTFDVITHDRPYKAALSVEEAVDEIKFNSGKQFDPKIVEAFLSISGKERFV